MLLNARIVGLAVLLLVLAAALLAIRPADEEPPATLEFRSQHTRVFVSPLTGQLTAIAQGRVLLDKSGTDTLLSIEGPARNIRAVRLRAGVNPPRSEDDFESILPASLSDLARRPFVIRLTQLAPDFPKTGAVDLKFVFKKRAPIVVSFPIITPEMLKKLSQPRKGEFPKGADPYANPSASVRKAD